MTEMKLRPGIKFINPKDGEKYQVITFAKERTSEEKMIVYQQLFEPFTIYAESVESFSSRMKRNDIEKNVSQQNRETNRETNCFTKNEEAKEPEIHPEFRRFLDARSNAERIEILKGMRNIVDDTMINSMAVIMDVEIKDGPIEARFDELLECIQMKSQYEIERY